MSTMKVTKRRTDDYIEPIGFESLADDKKREEYFRKISYWIGRFIIEFNDLDTLITDAISNHFDSSDWETASKFAYIFLSGLPYNQKVQILERYYQYWLPILKREKKAEWEKKTKDFISRLTEFGKIRNTIVHADYYSFDKDGNVVSKNVFDRGDVEQTLVSITRDFLVENINAMNDLHRELYEFDETAEEWW